MFTTSSSIFGASVGKAPDVWIFATHINESADDYCICVCVCARVRERWIETSQSLVCLFLIFLVFNCFFHFVFHTFCLHDISWDIVYFILVCAYMHIIFFYFFMSIHLYYEIIFLCIYFFLIFIFSAQYARRA